MLVKIVNYIFLLLSLSIIASTTALQYSHNSLSHQHCSTEACDDTQDVADECALCWFAAHQVSAALTYDTIRFEAHTHTIITQFKRMPKACAIDLLVLLKGNKDPPRLI